MRTVRMSLAGTVVLVLLAGLSSAVLAQATAEDPLDPMRPSQFTGSWLVDWEGEFAGWAWTDLGDYSESLDNESVTPFEASDPRISGTWTQVASIRKSPIDIEADIFALVWSGVVRIENEAGAWSGTFDGYYGEDGVRELYRLDGEDAYDGLTAVLSWVEEGDTYDGVIIAGVPPEYPELPAE